MKIELFCAAALTCAVSTSAQVPPGSRTSQPGMSAAQTLTVTGCVGGGANTEPFTLSNATVAPATSGPAVAPVAVAGPTTFTLPAAPGAVQPPPAPRPQPVTGVAPLNPTAAAGATATPPSVGTAGTAATGGGAPAGMTGISGFPREQVTPGAAATGAAVATPTTAIAGYRLTGTDMSAFLDQVVTVVGTIVPPTAPAGASGSATGPTGTASAVAIVQMPEFHVVSVQPTTGRCPERD